MSLLDKCKEIGQPIIEDMGYFLVDIEFVREGKNRVLRYLVDSDKGVDIDDCAIMSEKISELLDEHDPIKEEYILEISSPGAERVLKTKEDVKKAINKYVHVKLYEPINKQKVFEGDLINFDKDVLTIRYKDKNVDKTVDINYDKIAKIRLAIKF